MRLVIMPRLAKLRLRSMRDQKVKVGFSLKLDRPADIGSADEKRAYFRLLRYLLSERLQASYNKDQVLPLPSRMTNLLKALEEREPRS